MTSKVPQSAGPRQRTPRRGRVTLDGMTFWSSSSSSSSSSAPLPGRSEPLPGIPTTHTVLGSSMQGPWPEGTEVLYVAMGCFWGAERIFWQLPGVVTTGDRGGQLFIRGGNHSSRRFRREQRHSR